ncbi:MAG: polymer-forming cytoskeletal protein [Acidobacteria bacterium]|nr:polymer-forming cytoskeletal protein [Acidobacteriota bacterium]
MWKRRDREEEQPARSNPEPAKESTPLSNTPAVRSYEPESPRGVATIGKAVYIKGQIIAREDLVVDGSVDGTIEAQEHRVTIGPNGKVAATIKARHIIIQGQITGNIEGTEKVEIRNGAKLLGDVKTVKFVCEEEGTINGSVSSLRPESKPAPAAEPKASSATPPAQQTLTPNDPKK